MELDAIRERVTALAAEIDAPPHAIPTFGFSRDLAWPHIEEADGVMSWVVVERGREIQRRSTTDITELLYWVFQEITGFMGTNWEANNRVPLVDTRVLGFSRTLALLNRLDGAWRDRELSEFVAVLRDYPLREDYDDPAAVTSALVESGLRARRLPGPELDETMPQVRALLAATGGGSRESRHQDR